MHFALLLDLLSLLRTCAPEVAPETLAAVVEVESGGNPYAIGVVGGRLKTQPKTAEEAVAVAEKLAALGKNFSLGLAQINVKNLPKLGLTYELAFDPCENLRAASSILKTCYQRAQKSAPDEQKALTDALSCYYSGNFTRGYQEEGQGPSYVAKVRAALRPLASPVVPVLAPSLPRPPILAAPPALPSAPAAVRAAPVSSPRPLPSPLLVPQASCQGAVLDVCVCPPLHDVPPSRERKEATQSQSSFVF